MRRFVLLAAAAFLPSLAGSAMADCAQGSCDSSGCCESKPDDYCCGSPGVCRPVVSMVPIKKKCYEIVCKDICIPAVRPPWAKCCDELKCGRVRTVKTFKKVEYECGEECKVEWTIEYPCHGGCKADGCDADTSGCARASDAYEEEAPAPADPAPAPPVNAASL